MFTTHVITRTLHLKDMGEALLASELIQRADELAFRDDMEKAIAVAALMHRDQTRANRGALPKDTYVTHPLRNALRLMRYGVTHQDVIIAAVLHDTVEDAANKIVYELAGQTYITTPTAKTLRYDALLWINENFGFPVGTLVEQLSNPLREDGVSLTKEQKRIEYFDHVESVMDDPRVVVDKLTDLVDNAVGLYHNTGMLPQARYHLALKYQPVLELFFARIHDEDVVTILTEDGVRKALVHLEKGRVELQKMIDEALAE